MNEAILIARLVVGLGIAAHGAQKLFGWFGGPHVRGTGGFLEGLGFHPGHVFAVALGLCEMGGGLLTALGLFGPIGPALVILPMLVATFVVHWDHGFFNDNHGFELPAVYVGAALAIAAATPGRWSLDAALGLESLWNPRLLWIAVAAAAVLAIANVAIGKAGHRPTEAHA